MLKNDSELNNLIKLGGFVGLAQINPIAGKLEYNSEKIISYIKQAESLELDIIAFSQNALLGNELTDFINRFPFIIKESKIRTLFETCILLNSEFRSVDK